MTEAWIITTLRLAALAIALLHVALVMNWLARKHWSFDKGEMK